MKRTLLGIIFIFIVSFESFSQETYVWWGGSNSWTSRFNWRIEGQTSAPPSAPTANDNVIIRNNFGGTPTITSTISCRNLTIEAATNNTKIIINSGQLNVRSLQLISPELDEEGFSGGTASVEINGGVLKASHDIELMVRTPGHPERATIDMRGGNGILEVASNIWLLEYDEVNGTWDGSDGSTGLGTLLSSASSIVRFIGGAPQYINSLSELRYNNIQLNNAGGAILLGALNSSNLTGEVIINTTANFTTFNNFNSTDYPIVGTVRVLSGDKNLTISSVTNLIIEGTGTKTLLGNTTVTNSLTMTSGILSTGSNTLTVENSAQNAVTGSGVVNGNLQRAVTHSTLYSFPVGTSSLKLLQIELAEGSTVGYLTVNHEEDGAQSSPLGEEEVIESDGAMFEQLFSNEYWEVTPFPTNATATYNLRLSPGLFGADGSYTVVKRVFPYNLTTPWQIPGDIYNPNNSGTSIQDPTGTPYVGRNGISGFSNFSIASSPDPVPVDLEFFKAKVVKDYVVLDWATLSETNSSHFEIQRSRDSKNFETIGSVHSAGNSSERLVYDYKDVTATDIFAEKLYYRLKQVDVNGQSRTYPMVAVNVGGIIRDSKILIHPNPASDFVKVISFLKEDIQLQVYTPQGNKIAETIIGGNETTLNTSKYKQGVYVFKFVSGSTVMNKKVIVQ